MPSLPSTILPDTEYRMSLRVQLKHKPEAVKLNTLDCQLTHVNRKLHKGTLVQAIESKSKQCS